MRNLLAHAGKSGRRVVAAFVATAFAQEDAQTAKTQWRQVADVNGGAKLVHPGGAKLVHLMLCGARCWGVVPVVHRRDTRCFV